MNWPVTACGYKRLTSSGAVGNTSAAKLLVGYTILSGATAAVPYFLDGGSTGAIATRGAGTGSVAVTTALPFPTALANGLYVSFDANTTEVTAFYIEAA